MALYYYGCELYKNEQTRKSSVQYFEKSAEKDVVLAKYRLGQIYKEGKYAIKDQSKAQILFKEAYESREKWPYKWAVEYHLYLADAYENGLGCDVNKKQAYNIYLQLAKKGNLTSSYKVAEFLRYGFGVEKNVKEALNWYYKIFKHCKSSKDCALAAYSIGAICGGEEDGFLNAQNALDYLDRIYSNTPDLYEKGQLLEGKIHFYGIGKEVDYNKAQLALGNVKNIPEAKVLLCVARARNQSRLNTNILGKSFSVFKMYANDFPIAKIMLAYAYRYGYGVNKDPTVAAKLFGELPDSAEACYELGLMYLNGIGVEQNDKKAYELFNLARGDWIRAEYQTAICLMQGIGCDKNEVSAAEMFKSFMNKLVPFLEYSHNYREICDEEANYLMSQLYRYGWGVEKDTTQKKNFMRKCIGYWKTRYDEGLDFEHSGKLNVAKGVYADAARKGDSRAYVRLAAAAEGNEQLQTQCLNKAIEIGNRDAILIKAGKLNLTPFGSVETNLLQDNNSNNKNGSILQKTNSALKDISKGLREINNLFR